MILARTLADTIGGAGSVAEWSIAPVLKTGGSQGPVSSNLTASARRGVTFAAQSRGWRHGLSLRTVAPSSVWLPLAARPGFDSLAALRRPMDLNMRWTLPTAGPWISERLDITAGKASGFDYLRIGLAMLIVCFHSIITTQGAAAQSAFNRSTFGVAVLSLLPMFFALSGFLVAGSLERSRSLFVFLGLRVMRIFPALALDTVFCALILGPLFTTLPWPEYFAHPMFHAYLLNILGDIHYHLPGVFAGNPDSQVNGQLWTVPAELECYVLLAALAAAGIARRRWLMLALFALATAYFEWRLAELGGMARGERLLVLCFIAGLLLHSFRDRIRFNPFLFTLSVAGIWLCLSNLELGYLIALPAAYATVYLGLQNPRKSRLLASGDYSYGVFLYGFPLQQALVASTPLARTWYGNIALALPLALCAGVLSWHLVEKRVLARKPLLFSAQQWLSAFWAGLGGLIRSRWRSASAR